VYGAGLSPAFFATSINLNNNILIIMLPMPKHRGTHNNLLEDPNINACGYVEEIGSSQL
jgi:hypothetical protein